MALQHAKRRPVFAPAPSIPVLLRPSVVVTPPGPSTSHPGPSETFLFSEMTDGGGSTSRSDTSSLLQFSPIHDFSREVLFSPSLVESARVHHPSDEVFLKSLPHATSNNSFTKLHAPIQTSSIDLPRTMSDPSLARTLSQLITHENSDGGLATSTHRIAVNTRKDTLPRNPIFGNNAKPVHLPKLDAHLATFRGPSFSPWTDILTTEELQEYQFANMRKFPLLHMISGGLSLSDLKTNTLKRKVLPGFENDCWRFLVDVSILTAGSPYAKYMTLEIFRQYTRSVISLYTRSDEIVVDKFVTITGGGTMSLTLVFLIILLLLYKSRPLADIPTIPQSDEVYSYWH
jgi:hypothetical protein